MFPAFGRLWTHITIIHYQSPVRGTRIARNWSWCSKRVDGRSKTIPTMTATIAVNSTKIREMSEK
jgi:hypothetical protein